MVIIYELMHTIPFLQLSCTESHHYGVSFCKAFFPSLYLIESANMLADVIPTQHVTSSGIVQTTEFEKISCQYSLNFHDMSSRVGMTCHLGGSDDTTRCQHFQLRTLHQYQSETMPEQNSLGQNMRRTRTKVHWDFSHA